MKKLLRLFVAVAVPATLMLAAGADAKSKRWKRHGKRFYSKMIKAGALTKADMAGMKAAKKAWRACRKDVRAKKAARGSCRAKKLELYKAKVALYGKINTSGKVVRKRWQRKIKRKLKRLARKIKRLEAKLAAPPK